MVDFIKSFNGAVSIDDYMWKYSIPMIKIMGIDNSHVNYLSENEAKNRGVKNVDVNNMSVEELNNDLGVKIKFPGEQ